MVCFHTIDHHMKMPKAEHINQSQKPSKKTPISTCEQSPSAWLDLVLLIAVTSACGFLIYPYASLFLYETQELFSTIIPLVKEEILGAPMIYGCLALSIFSASIALLSIMLCTSQKCGKPGCRGLHKAAEFDIKLETEDCANNSNSGGGNLGKAGLKKGLFELPRDYHRELEAELKKMAPVNGRAILVFRARCGCCVGTMEVPGPKKIGRKVKK